MVHGYKMGAQDESFHLGHTERSLTGCPTKSVHLISALGFTEKFTRYLYVIGHKMNHFTWDTQKGLIPAALQKVLI